jgi:hypothetical protein
MGRGRRTTLGTLRVACVFVAAAVVLLALAAGLLAGVGEITGDSVRAGGYSFTVGGAARFVRTPAGIEELPERPLASIAEPAPGDVLGSCHYRLTYAGRGGTPRFARIECTLEVWDIRPGPAGPDASDVRAWRSIVAAANSRRIRVGSPAAPAVLPAAILAGDPSSTERFPLAVPWNVLTRLLRAPILVGVCVALAFACTVLPRVARWMFLVRRARRAGRCARCGYELRDLTIPICPECGTPWARRSGSATPPTERPASVARGSG